MSLLSSSLSGWEEVRRNASERDARLKEADRLSDKFHSDADLLAAWLSLAQERLSHMPGTCEFSLHIQFQATSSPSQTLPHFQFPPLLLVTYLTPKDQPSDLVSPSLTLRPRVVFTASIIIAGERVFLALCSKTNVLNWDAIECLNNVQWMQMFFLCGEQKVDGPLFFTKNYRRGHGPDKPAAEGRACAAH